MDKAADQLVSTLIQRHMTICTAESCTGGLLASMIVDVPGASDVFKRGFITYANDAKHDILGVSMDTLNTYGAVSPQVAEQMAKGAARAGAGGGACGGEHDRAGAESGACGGEHDRAGAENGACGGVLSVPGCRVVGVGITGIAGPGGGTAEKPVGLVYIGCHVACFNSVEDACCSESNNTGETCHAESACEDSDAGNAYRAENNCENACVQKRGRTYVKECHFSGDRRTVRESAAMEAIRFVLECILEMFPLDIP